LTTVSVTISHVIGTTTLLMVFTAATMFYTISNFSLQRETLAMQLQEAADYVSSNLVDLVSLCFISPTDQLLIKTLEMPENIGVNVYTVTLVEKTNPVTHEKLMIVKAHFDFRPSIYRESLLPWTTIKIWNGTSIGDLGRVEPKLSISSSASNMVIWALRQAEEITVGLGVMST